MNTPMVPLNYLLPIRGKCFEESGFEVYGRNELVTVINEQTEEQKEAETRRLAINELTERIRDMYWKMEDGGDSEQIEAFIEELESSLNPILRDV